MKSLLCSVLLVIATAHLGSAQSAAPTLYQDPDLSSTSIVFAYAGDLWSVDRSGGVARALTSGLGLERDARFSPDGTMIAFTGEYDGNTDVFVMPARGGVPERLSFHPGADSVVDWTPDGRAILFRSSRASSADYTRLFTVGLDGGLPEAVPLPHAFEGSFSPDGTHLAYQPIAQWQPDWKRHRGGQTGRIWIADLADSSVVTVPRENSNDTHPAWVGDTVYFLSDRADGVVGLFAYDTGSRAVRQVLKPGGLDIKSLAAGPDALVYEHFGTIYLYDHASDASSVVDVEVEGDFPGVRPRHVKVGKNIADSAISPTGKRAVFEARGEILTVPAEKGHPRNLTNSPGVMERAPVWSPDGKWVAYFSDESGEYALHLSDQKGRGEVKRIDLGTPATYYYSPVWSPDSSKIAYADRRLNLWVVDVEDGTPVKIDTNPIGFRGDVLVARWSPDSSWIAYSRYLPNLMRAVFVYNLESHASHQLTDGMSDAAFPCFDESGKYLYFAASTDIGPGLSWADLSGIDHVSTRNVYALVLSKDEPSPLAPESDDEEPDKEGEDDEGDSADDDDEGDDPSEDNGGDEPEPVRIDLEAVDQRLIALPIPGGNIVSLDAGKAGKLFVAVSPPSHFGDRGNGVDVKRFDLEEKEVEDFLSGVSAFTVSADGEKVLYRKVSTWTIAGAGGEPEPGEDKLAIDAMTVRVDPPAEWRQMFADAWRGERDHFYAPNHHGLDIEAAKALYEPYLGAVKHREDLNYLFREMLNQLTIGHMFIRGGDAPEAKSVPGGLLGCDFTVENDRYRMTAIFDGENWNPDLRAPLTEPGVNVGAGEYLLEVNGRELRGSDNVYELFENTAGTQVSITVGKEPEGADSREVTVVPVRRDYSLRHRAWAEGNRRRVDELSDGRLAYIYVPNTGGSGFTNFNRYFFAQTDRQGAVVDERYNQGGLLADYVADTLTRPQLSAISFRYAEQDIRVPGGAIYGPKAMLINGMAGSGGDAMPWYFQKMKIGPLIGTRTWGGLVASSPGPQLMDGGGYTAPDAAVYGLDGEWEVENAGVAPDIEVELDPAEWRKGRDPQLERAVEHLLAELEANPPSEAQRPEYPVYERCCGLNGS